MQRFASSQQTQYVLRIMRTALIACIIVFVVAVPVFLYCNYKVKARFALSEAKNVELAMNMLSIELYGIDSSIFDSTQPSGLKEGYLEHVQSYADVDGTLVVTAWDTKRNRAAAFQYTTGHYTVYYQYDNVLKQGTWNIDYAIHVAAY